MSRQHQTWIARNWRPLCGVVYIAICLFDFVLMPSVMEWEHYHTSIADTVALALKFDGGATQIGALQSLHEDRTWQPLTLAQNGLFHMAFGAILGAAAWTRGKEKIAALQCQQDAQDAQEPGK